jgi:putative integral membrane protein (TIGR02587 family)
VVDDTHTRSRQGQEPDIFDRRLNLHFLVGLARACAGAILFALPMLMTMEMWSLGLYLHRLQLALLLLVTVPMLIGLSHYIGFERTFELKKDLVDALVAYAVGFSASWLVLLLLAVIEPGMSQDEIIGKVALQAVPAAMGALLAQGQLGQKEDEAAEQRDIGYFGTLFLMGVGALFLALNLAPTEEMILIAYRMTVWHALLLAGVSLLVMHGFVYAVNFSGAAPMPPGAPLWRVFLRYTVVGYALVLLVSLFVLWLFGRIDGVSLQEVLMTAIVLGFPAAVGAAAARLIL